MTPILARQRPDRSFERLYEKHVADVYRYALVVLRNQADAEDVTQTTFMNAYRAFERGERPRAPQNWLIAIAHNVCRQRFRQSQRRPSEVELNEELAESIVNDDRISAEDIRRALGHLGFNQRAALVMRELEGRSYQEIAEILDVSVSAVETLIFRARRALREQLEEGITCHDAELAISRQLDGRLSRKEKSGLRAHLRECDDCARFARSQRAQRGAIKSLALIPLPSSLTSFFGHGGSTAAATGGGAALGGGLAVKAAALGAGALVATGVGYEGVKQIRHGSSPPNRVAASASTQGAPAARAFVATAEPIARDTDLKPSRARSVHARRGHHGRPAVGRAHRRHKEVSPLPPSRGRAHDQKPVNPGRPASPGKSNQHRHQGRVIHQKPKPPPPPRHQKPPPPPPPPPHGNGGGNGHGTDTPPPTGHGNAH